MRPHVLLGIDTDEDGGLDALLVDVACAMAGESFDARVMRGIMENKGIVVPAVIVGGH